MLLNDKLRISKICLIKIKLHRDRYYKEISFESVVCYLCCSRVSYSLFPKLEVPPGSMRRIETKGWISSTRQLICWLEWLISKAESPVG